MAKKVDPIKEAGLEVKLNTPIGVGQYLYLEQPDFEYNSAGDWKVKLFLDPTKDDVKEMMATMDKLLEEAVEYFTDKAETPKKKKLVRPSDNTPYYFETDDEDEPTGRIYINPKSIASGTTKEGKEWKRQMPIFDAQGVRVTEKLNAGSGTTLRASLLLRAYYNAQSGVGVSLRLTAIQVIDLKQFGAGIQTAEDAGFGAVDGGFSADKFESPTTNVEEGTDEEASEDEDGDY
jgi:hypothetical protein